MDFLGYFDLKLDTSCPNRFHPRNIQIGESHVFHFSYTFTLLSVEYKANWYPYQICRLQIIQSMNQLLGTEYAFNLRLSLLFRISFL